MNAMPPKLPKQGRIGKLPDLATLRARLRLCPEHGKLFWMARGNARWDGRYAGKEAFTATSANGYKVGRLNGSNYYAHRIIYCLHWGRAPQGEIDHINGNRTDNRPCNLRSVSRVENQRNKRWAERSKSGAVGVYWHPELGKWAAAIGVENKLVHIGVFARKSDAINARSEAEKHYGFSARHGHL